MNNFIEFSQLSEKFCSSHLESYVGDISKVIEAIITNYDENVNYSYIYTPLSNLINNVEVNSYLLSHLFSLLSKFGSSYEKRTDIGELMAPSIANQILYRYKQQPSDSMIRYCLEALQCITLDVHIRIIPPVLNQVLHLLVKLILKKEDNFLDLSLAVLSNICRNSLLAQASIKSVDSIRMLYSKLMNLLGSDHVSTIAYSLSLFTSLCLHEDLGKKLFVGNVKETFQLVINMVKTGDDYIKICSLNLLIDFCKSDSMFKSFVAIPHLHNLLEEIIQCCVSESALSVQNKCSEFLYCISKHDTVYQTIAKLVESSNEFSCYLFDNIGQYHMAVLIKSFMPQIVDNMSENGQQAVIKSLVSIIDEIPLHTANRYRYKTVAIACNSLFLLATSNNLRKSVEFYGESLHRSFTTWLDHTPNPFDRGNQYAFTVEACNCFVGMVELNQAVSSDNMELLYRHQYFSVFLGKSLVCSDNDVVYQSLNLLRHSVAIKSCFKVVGSIVANESHLFKMEVERLVFETKQLQQKVDKAEKEMVISQTTPQSPVCVPENVELTELIGQLKDGLKIEDVKASQLLEIFQEKINILTTKEQHLNDLVDAKTIALQQSDRLFTQFRNRVSQAESESLKYRTLLQESEKENENHQDLIRKLEQKVCFYTAEVEKYAAELGEAEVFKARYQESQQMLESLQDKQNEMISLNSDLTEKLHNLKEEVEVLKVHNETLKSQHDVNVDQIQILQKEKQKVVTKLEEKDTLLLKTKQSLRQAEEKNRKKDKENLEVGANLSKVKAELSKACGKINELEAQEMSLKLVLSDKDKELDTQKVKIKELHEEVDKYEKLMAMFHNLSSGKKA